MPRPIEVTPHLGEPEDMLVNSQDIEDSFIDIALNLADDDFFPRLAFTRRGDAVLLLPDGDEEREMAIKVIWDSVMRSQIPFTLGVDATH